MKKVLSLVLAVAMLLGYMSFASAEEGKIKLVVWSFTNELQGMIEKYYLPNHPELEIEFQIYPTDGSAYTTKVDNTLGANAASDEAPDIFTLEAAFVKHYVESPWTGDLKEVGFTDEELATAFPSSPLLPAARFAHGEALARLLRFDEISGRQQRYHRG